MPGIDPYLMPAAHALMQASEDLEHAARGLTAEQLWARPGGAAAPGFHLRHIAGVIDRLFTYARGEALNDSQREALSAESTPGDAPPGADVLIARAQRAISTALDTFRDTPREQHVLAELEHGLPNKLIAAKLNLSENTVKMHIQHIMRKFAAHNRTEAVLRWRTLIEALVIGAGAIGLLTTYLLRLARDSILAECVVKAVQQRP